MKGMDIVEGHYYQLHQIQAMDVQTKFSICPLKSWLLPPKKWSH